MSGAGARFRKGVCTNSYGMNCARLAGLPTLMVDRAEHMAREFELQLRKAHKQDFNPNAGTLEDQLMSAIRALDSSSIAKLVESNII